MARFKPERPACGGLGGERSGWIYRWIAGRADVAFAARAGKARFRVIRRPPASGVQLAVVPLTVLDQGPRRSSR